MNLERQRQTRLRQQSYCLCCGKPVPQGCYFCNDCREESKGELEHA